MLKFRLLPAFALLLCCLALAPFANADTGGVAAAQVLFDEAKALMGDGRHREACPKLEESQRLDPGVGTLFQLAVCYEEVGRTASAWGRYEEAAASATALGQADRAEYAKQQAARLEPKLSRLIIDLPKSARISELRIERDGVPVGAGSLGVAVPVDAGPVRVHATAPGYQDWETTVDIQAPGEHRVAVPALARDPNARAKLEPARAGGSPSDPKSDAGAAPVDGGASPLAWVAISVGAAGAVLGGVAGAIVLDKKATLDGKCPDKQCPPEMQSEHDAFNRWRNVSTIGFVVGAIGIATGVTVLLTSSSSEPNRRVSARLGPGGAAVSGTF